MRTMDHVCQQFDVEFGRVSVNTHALLSEVSRDARLLAWSKMIPESGTFRVHSDIHNVFKCTLYLLHTDTNGVVHRRP